MKKVFGSLTIILLLFSNYLHAQVPGLDGKRFSFYYFGSFGLRTSAPAYDPTYNENPSKFGINYRHNFDIDYVVSKNIALGAGFKLLRTAETNIDFSSQAYDLNYPVVNMKTKFISFFIKKFAFEKSGFIAPVGSYQKFELALGFTNTYGNSVQPNDYEFSSKPIPYQSLNFPTVTSLVFFYTVGQQQIIAKRIYIDYGLDFGFPLTIIGKALNASDETQDTSDLNVAKYKSDTETRLLTHILFNAHLGTGILLF